MNVALLLITTAWAAGADAAPPKEAAAAPPVMPAPAAVMPAPAMHPPPLAAPSGSCCGGDCGAVSDCGCAPACESPSFFARCKARFQKHHGADCAPDCGCAPAPADCCGAVASCSEEKPGLFARLKHRFGKHHGEECAPACESGCSSCGDASGTIVPAHPVMPPATGHPVMPPATAPAGESIKKMPEGADDKGKEDGKKGKGDEESRLAPLPPRPAAAAPAAGKNEEGPKNPFDLDRRYEKRVGRAADYSRLTGQLFYVHADGGLWVLRYAPLGKEEANGGSVILARDRQMDNYRDGDLVTVEGSVVQDRGSSRLGGALYRARSIQLLDRPPE